MPTYDYRCLACEHKMEAFQKITDPCLTICPACQKNELRRGPGGGIGLSFAGAGFYINDYKTESVPKKECCPCDKSNAKPKAKEKTCLSQ